MRWLFFCIAALCIVQAIAFKLKAYLNKPNYKAKSSDERRPTYFPGNGKIRVRIQANDVQLSEVLRAIEIQTEELGFFLCNDEINIRKCVTVNADNFTVDSVLQILFNGTDICWEYPPGGIGLFSVEKVPLDPPKQWKPSQERLWKSNWCSLVLVR